MARGVIGGLITSTLLTLLVVPVVYTYFDGMGALAEAPVYFEGAGAGDPGRTGRGRTHGQGRAGPGPPRIYVVMGVSGSGKSTIGGAFAHALGVEFVEGDAYHPPENVKLMAGGIPLTDADRAGWLEALAMRIGAAKQARKGIVLACSALKRSYRDILRAESDQVRFIFLRGSKRLLAERLANRSGHFMPASLLDSQLATLEEPETDEHAWVCEVTGTPASIVDDLVKRAST